MIRNSILPTLGGVVFAVVLSLSVPAKASCFGFCLQQFSNYYFAGCYISWWGSASDGLLEVTCYYTEGAPASGDPNIAD